jgi:hypothetical protein
MEGSEEKVQETQDFSEFKNINELKILVPAAKIGLIIGRLGL